MFVESVSSEFHLINDGGLNRKVAYSRLGEFNAKHIFLCLPGLLETRESFHPLLAMVEQFDDCCWISIDYCGRGNSDQLPAYEKYSFSKYLADTEDLIETLIQSQKPNSNQKFHLIGTSMGGILAMYLVNRLKHKVDSVVLNDIGFYLHWSALMSLYQNIKISDNQMIELNVDARAIEDVQRSSHFDLHYEFDLLGMRFHSLIQDFNGQVFLLHNAESPICSLNIANQSKTKFPNLKIWTLNKSGHPANWEKSFAIKLAQLVKIKPKSKVKMEIEEESKPFETAQEKSTFSFVFVDSFLQTSKAYLESTEKNRNRWVRQLLDRLKFVKSSYS
jgi:pimeloyl-ACP methyl ester carboxylesterase